MSVEEQIERKEAEIVQLQIELAALKVQQKLQGKEKAYAPNIFPYKELEEQSEQYGFDSYVTCKKFLACCKGNVLQRIR